MWSEVSQIRQPHDGALEANKKTEQNEFEQERQLYLRAQRVGLAIKEILLRTGYRDSGADIPGVPYTMVSKAVDVGELTGETGELGFHEYIRACVAFDKKPHKVVEPGRYFNKTRTKYVPDFEKVSTVGMIYLLGPPECEEPAHKRSVYWTRNELVPVEDVIEIEEGLEAIQNALTKLTVVQNEIAS